MTLALLSVAVHALLLLGIRYDQRGSRGAALAVPEATQVGATLDPSCVADEVLAGAARLAYCATPFAGDPDACVDSAAQAYRLGVVACRSTAMTIPVDADPVSVALLPPHLLEQLKPTPIEKLAQPPEETLDEQLAKAVEEKHEQAEKAESRPVPAGQVVEITRPELEVAPDNARFVSEYDSKVDKETVARGTTEDMVDRPAPRPSPPENMFRPQQPDRPPVARGDGSEGDGMLAMRKPGLPEEQVPSSRVGPADGTDAELSPDGLAPRRGEGYMTEMRQRPDGDIGAGGGKAGNDSPSEPNLRPTPELLEKVAGGGSVDYMEGVAEGETTALNSKRWKYATFFNRLKRQVAQNWHPDVVYNNRDPNGNVYGTKDRITVLNVSLNKDGSVANIYISKGCGVDFLDEEAVRAFRAAQPFPNPPGALATGDRALITFSFGFHFQIGSARERWKIFRYR